MSGPNITTRILAIVLALFLWAYVRIVNEGSDIQRVVTNVPVALTGKAAAGLQPQLHVKDQYINIRIKGPSERVTNVLRDEVQATVDISRIARAQTVQMPVDVELPRGVWLAQKPQDVTVQVIKLVQEQFPVSVSFIAAPSPGTTVGSYRILPDTVTVEGKNDAMEKVAYVTALVDPNERLAGVRKLVPYAVDANGERIQDVHVLEATVDVSLASFSGQPVTRSVAVRPPQLLNLPKNYIVTVGAVRPDEVTLSGEASLLEKQSPYVETEPIDVRNLRHDETRTVRIRVPRGLSIVEGGEVRVDLIVQRGQ